MHTSKAAHQAEAYPGFCSMRQIGVFPLSPGLEASASQGYPQHYIRCYPFIHLGGVRLCETKVSCPSLQNRRNFLRILGEWRRKGGKCEARVAREGRTVKDSLALLSLHATRASCSPHACLAFASIRLKYAKNSACSAG